MSRTDLDINAGETTALALTLKDENGDPIDLTTCTRLELAAKRNVDDTEYLFRKTLGAASSSRTRPAGSPPSRSRRPTRSTSTTARTPTTCSSSSRRGASARCAGT
jgi:hypothetical protein